jgi:hypothetical protein
MGKRRFQECGRLEKAWRYRWYICVPFLWMWHQAFPLLATQEDGTSHKIEGRNLWRVLLGSMQYRMSWYYTMEEVQDRIKLLSEDRGKASRSRSRPRDRA